MIDFYALTSPNVQKIYIMLEETGLPYKEIFVDVWKGDQYKPEFLKINPKQQDFRRSSITTDRTASRTRCSNPARSCSTLPTRPAASCRRTWPSATKRSSG